MLSFFQRDVFDEILNLIESVSEGFPSYSLIAFAMLVFFCVSEDLVYAASAIVFH